MKLYNTLTRTKEEFVPLVPGHVTMYNCGPTVYNFIHVGNARPLVVFDTLRRYFIYSGLDVKFVVNFTDIDDKLINKANDEGITVNEVANRYIEEFKVDAIGLNLYDYTTINPRATEMIPEMIEFINELIKKDAAYVSEGDVYFNIEAAKDYGKLSKKNLEDLIAGSRVDVSELKRNPADFVLWKKKKEGEPFWSAPWSDGRPGWHIECSVMAKTLLGETIDIHSGGEDLQFPHHENEIAQSETCNEVPFARYWLHNGMITVDKEKMSKSKGNFFTVREVSKEYDLEVLRFFLLSAHYRSPINFSKEAMDSSKNALERLYNGKERLSTLLKNSSSSEISKDEEILLSDLEKEEDHFKAVLDDDINTADGLTVLFNIVKMINSNLDENSSKEVLEKFTEVFERLSKVLGLLHKTKEEEIPAIAYELVEERNASRKEKNFKRADEIRDELLEMGIEIKDTRSGTICKRINS